MANTEEKRKGRKQNQRLKLFYLLDYLLENSDENHAVKIDDIKLHFQNLDIPVEQKTIYTDLHLLDEYGYETRHNAKERGWQIIERDFETQELQLPINSIQLLNCGFLNISHRNSCHNYTS